MTLLTNITVTYIIKYVKTLQSRLHIYGGVCRCCNNPEGSHRSGLLRLALHHHRRTLCSVQLKIPE